MSDDQRKPYTPPRIREIVDPLDVARIMNAHRKATDYDLACAVLTLLEQRGAQPMNSFSALGAVTVGFARGLMVSREAFVEMMANAYDASVRATEPLT